METTTPPPKQAAVWKPPRFLKMRIEGLQSGSKMFPDDSVWEGSTPWHNTYGYRMPTSIEPAPHPWGN